MSNNEKQCNKEHHCSLIYHLSTYKQHMFKTKPDKQRVWNDCSKFILIKTKPDKQSSISQHINNTCSGQRQINREFINIVQTSYRSRQSQPKTPSSEELQTNIPVIPVNQWFFYHPVQLYLCGFLCKLYGICG